MKKNKLKAFLLAICVALPTMFALTACGHKHSFSEDWTSDATNHWHVCTDEDCDETSDSTEHTFVAKKDGTNHWSECSVCGYKKDEAAHNYATTKYDATSHWKECSCGDKKDEEAHDITVAEINTTNHKLKCDDCGYLSGEIDHTYEEDDQTECDVCTHERDQATLAFKAGTTGTYELTYDGNAHAFDKNSLVTVSSATIDEVVVEYSVSGAATPVWTTEAPKNAGTYNIRISVPATKDHTSAVATKQFKINQIEIDLTNFSRVYSLEEATCAGSLTEKVTSADFSEIVSSEEVPLTIVRNTAVSITEGTSHDLKWYTETQEGADGDAFALLRTVSTGLSNYKIKTGTKGKIYIANSLTVSEGSYSAQATIQKDGYAYYSLKMDRTSKNINFDVTLSNSNVEIVDVYSKVNWLTAKIAADGTLVTNGTVTGTGTIFIVVKYNGAEDSITNTLTLTQNTATTTVANTSSLTSAINLENVDQYHATLKEDGTVIEENKVDKTNNKYYKSDSKTEVYYERYNSEVSFLEYKKNNINQWVRKLVYKDASSINDSAANVLNATKFSSALLSAFTNINQLTFTPADQMYHVNSFDVSEDTYTNVALKFENGQLVYAEYKLSDKTYTIEFEYDNPSIVMPSYAGQQKDNPLKVQYIRTNQNFSASDIFVNANLYTYCEFGLDAKTVAAYKDTEDDKCSIQGTVTADVEGAEIQAWVYTETGTDNLNTVVSSKDGKIELSNLTAGKYKIVILCNKPCSISINLEKLVSSGS